MIYYKVFLDIYWQTYGHLHDFVVPDYFNCNVLITSGLVPGPDDVAEYTLASIAVHHVPAV